MKKIIVIALLAIVVGCKKDHNIPLAAGHTYQIRSNVFNKGAFQPKDTLYANSVYLNTTNGDYYCKCTGPGINVPVALLDSLNGQILWDIPTDDLK